MFCKNCGKEINDNAVICVNCGAPTETTVSHNFNNFDKMTGGLTALCILIPLVGLIIGIVKQSSGAVISGKKCIKYSLIAWGIYLLISCGGIITFIIFWA